jgi:hypothetical protein
VNPRLETLLTRDGNEIAGFRITSEAT